MTRTSRGLNIARMVIRISTGRSDSFARCRRASPGKKARSAFEGCNFSATSIDLNIAACGFIVLLREKGTINSTRSVLRVTYLFFHTDKVEICGDAVESDAVSCWSPDVDRRSPACTEACSDSWPEGAAARLKRWGMICSVSRVVSEREDARSSIREAALYVRKFVKTFVIAAIVHTLSLKGQLHRTQNS